MADQRILYTERMVGAGHPTLADTLNRLPLVEHNTDGTHKMDTIQQASDSVNGIMSSVDKAKLDAIDLVGAGVGQPYIKFDVDATGAPASEGTVNWNNADGCLEFKTGLGNVVQIGKELGDSGVNKTGGAVSDGQVVYASGAQGGKIEFSYADAREAAKCAFVGVVTYSTANNAEGPVTSYGTVRNLDTSGWVEGTKLYVAANATGNLTSIAPAAPNFRIWVATVTYSHVSNGSIFVDPKLDYTNGITLTNLDVNTQANLPSSTTIGSVSATEIGYLDGVTSAIQTQLNNKEVSGATSTHASLTSTHGVTGNIVGTTDTQTLTNKTLNLTSNTVAGTLAEFNTALTDGDFATIAGYETLTNKTFVAPVLGTATGTSFNSITGLANTAPVMDGTATVGVSTLTARQDHVHPTDTSRQATLVSGTNIKTVNSTSILGSGDIVTPGVTDGDKGDITVSGGGATWTVDVKDPYGFFKSDFASAAYTKTTAATLSVKAGTFVLVGTTVVSWATATAITMPTHTIGTDYYIYACTDGTVRADANASAPTGYTTANSRKIGGYHYGRVRNTLTVTDVAVEIVPRSLWDLTYRPKCNPAGMVDVWGNGSEWLDIYQPSVGDAIVLTNGVVTAGTAVSKYNALPLTGTEGLNGYNLIELAARSGKRLAGLSLWLAGAHGSPQGNDGDNFNAWSATTNTGRTTTGQIARAVSFVGACDCVGNVWEWLDEFSNDHTTTAYAWQNVMSGQNVGQLYLPNASGLRQYLAGGSWAYGVFAGSRALDARTYPWGVGTGIGSRFACDGL